MQELQTSQENLRMLAEETGGVAFVGRNDFDAAFDRIVQENSAYYVLGYYSTNERRDGKMRNISVRVAGYPDAQVTYRKRYAAARGRGPEEHGGRQAARSVEKPDGRARQHDGVAASRRRGSSSASRRSPKKAPRRTATSKSSSIRSAGDLTFTEKNGRSTTACRCRSVYSTSREVGLRGAA
jgi:hypothetical protein